MRGIARFLVTETAPELSLYATPIQIDPEAPALAISHPSYYAAYLAKLLGAFATLGMAEDTWALNEGAIDEAAFLEQAWLTLAEREAMFENALAHTRRGSAAVRIDAWVGASARDLAQWERMQTDMRSAGAADFATLSVGIEALRRLAV